MKKSTTEEFIKKANIVHNNKYLYHKTIYINNKTEVIVTCYKHGDFKKRPDMHLQKQGCYKCSKTNNYFDFIIKANEIHNNKYEYSEFIWKNSKEKIKIKCKKHDIFTQRINDHLNGSGCPICNKKILTKENFLKKVKKIHKKYDYSKLIFNKATEKGIIGCPIHGYFEQVLWYHYNGSGCPKCSKTSTKEDFIKKSNNIHNFLYDYSEVDYKKSNSKVKIKCKLHGVFYQSPNHHLQGNSCPICKNSKGETMITNYLKENNIIFSPQHTFENCKYKQKLPFDFYLPKINTCIEFDGEQHFRSSHFFGGQSALETQQLRDQIKTNFCLQNNITLIRIKYNENILEKLQSQL